jgi:hypothetical protein
VEQFGHRRRGRAAPHHQHDRRRHEARDQQERARPYRAGHAPTAQAPATTARTANQTPIIVPRFGAFDMMGSHISFVDG